MTGLVHFTKVLSCFIFKDYIHFQLPDNDIWPHFIFVNSSKTSCIYFSKEENIVCLLE